ncbi:hypothetical protein C8J56DRAFT_1043041 [Mycena floridula]|nr:hypothetical protein C8J56DRAFT_1043041 [Mycena floridula]
MTARRQASTTSLAQFAHDPDDTYSQYGHDASSPYDPSRPGQPRAPAASPLDFANAFWGGSTSGPSVLFARLRGAIRTVEELRAFWKERAQIEEDYAKRLGRLGKGILGKDEIGELRSALTSILHETTQQSSYHLTLASSIKTDLELPTTNLHAKLLAFKKDCTGPVERELKKREDLKGTLDKARERYEQECMRINSYTAQSSLVQGRDLEKLRLKLDRAKGGVGQLEKEARDLTGVYREQYGRWVETWRGYCDSFQDVEEERGEVVKDLLWAYANAVSTVCVKDDESCENWRTFLEQMDLDGDIQNFVREYGTGAQIPEPPVFVDYNAHANGTAHLYNSSASAARETDLTYALPSPSSYKPPVTKAQFPRNRKRERRITVSMDPALTAAASGTTAGNAETEEEEEIGGGKAGVGALGQTNGSYFPQSTPLQNQPTGTSSRQRSQSNAGSQYGGAGASQPYSGAGSQYNAGASQSRSGSPTKNSRPESQYSASASSSSALVHSSQRQNSMAASPSQYSASPSTARQDPASRQSQDPLAEPIPPNADTFIKVGSNAYRVDVGRDPQSQATSSTSSYPSSTSSFQPSSASVSASNYAGAGAGSSSYNDDQTQENPRGEPDDPLARHLQALQSAVQREGSVRVGRKGSAVPQISSAGSPSSRGSFSASGRDSGTGPSGGAGSQRDNRGRSPGPGPSNTLPPPNEQQSTTAESGVYDPEVKVSVACAWYVFLLGFGRCRRFSLPLRLTDPQLLGHRSSSPHPDGLIEGVVSDYQQSFPGERKELARRGSYVGPSHAPSNSLSRPGSQAQQSRPSSRQASLAQPSNAQPSRAGSESNQAGIGTLSRPSSRQGHAGIGAHGGSRSASPNPSFQGSFDGRGSFEVSRQGSFEVSRQGSFDGRQSFDGRGSVDGRGSFDDGAVVPFRQGSSSQQQNQQGQGHNHNQSSGSRDGAKSPNVGIALDPSGRVVLDEMASEWRAASTRPGSQAQVRAASTQGQQMRPTSSHSQTMVIRRPTSIIQPPPPPPPALYSAGFQAPASSGFQSSAPASAGFQSSPSSTGFQVPPAPGYAAPPAPVQGYTSPGSYQAQPAATYTPSPASYSTPASNYSSTPASSFTPAPTTALTPAQAYQQRYSNRSVSPAPGPQPSYAIPAAPTGYSGGQGQAAPQYSATGGGQGYSNQQGGGRSPTGYGHSQQGSGYSSHSQAQSHQGQAPGYQQSQATSYGHQSQPSYGQAPSYNERARSRSRSVGRVQAPPQAQSSQAPLTTGQVTEDGTPILFYGACNLFQKRV